MATNFPGSLDTSTQQPSPSSSTEMDDSGYEHDVVHTNHSGAIIALETKLGSTDSNPVSGAVLIGTGSGTSEWDTSPTLASNLGIGNSAAVTPNSSWNGHLTIAGNGYSGGLSLDDTGMWIGHNSSSRTIIFATNETSIGSFSASGSTDFSLHGGTGTGYTQASIMLSATGDSRGTGTYGFNAYNDTTWYWGNPYAYEDSFRVCRKSSTTSLATDAAHGGTYKLLQLMDDGDMTIQGTLTENSDSRLKREIADSSLGLDFVNALKPREYRRVDGTRKHYGFVAQEVADVLPDASDCAIWVNEQENVAAPDEEENIVSTQGLRYTHLIAPLVKAVQELTTRIEALEG